MKYEEKPVFVSAKTLSRFLEEHDDCTVVDTLEEQLDELYRIRHPWTMMTSPSTKDVESFKDTITQGDIRSYGRWVYYPWNRHLVHFLPHPIHTELRTARNRNLITYKEQMRYYRSAIAVAGLSVGHSVVTTIVQTGGGRTLRLADPDILSGSNINRIRSGFHQTGIKKVDVAARYVYEVDPYAVIRRYPEGISVRNIKRFLSDPRPVDVLVDEMDDLYLKVRVRVVARRLGIPVVMATDNGDNIFLDVERFDRDGTLPLFHGVIPERELLKIERDITRPQAASFIMRLVGQENVAPRMKESVSRLGVSLYTWPQLGNAAFLAGCAAAYGVRKIVTGGTLSEGRSIVSMDNDLAGGH